MKDREFWLIILTTWTMDEIAAWAEYAEVVERSTKW